MARVAAAAVFLGLVLGATTLAAFQVPRATRTAVPACDWQRRGRRGGPADGSNVYNGPTASAETPSVLLMAKDGSSNSIFNFSSGSSSSSSSSSSKSANATAKSSTAVSSSSRDSGNESARSSSDNSNSNSNSTLSSSSSSSIISQSKATPTKSAKTSSLWQSIDSFGASFKPRAEKASAKAYQQKKTIRTFLYNLKASFFYFIFILYRAYRGFFVLLPAVFRQVYAKLNIAMDDYNSALLDDDNVPTSELFAVNGLAPAGDGASSSAVSIDGGSSSSSSSSDGNNDDDSSSSSAVDGKPAKWRTRITVTVLTTIVTASYVLGGAMRVMGRFFKTITKKETTLQGSFEAAVGEVDRNEDRIKLLSQKNAEKNASSKNE